MVLYNIHIEAYLQEEREKLGSLETNPNTRDEKKDLQPAIHTNATGLSESYEDHSIIRFVIEPLIVAQDFFKKLLFKMSCLVSRLLMLHGHERSPFGENLFQYSPVGALFKTALLASV